MWAAAEGDSAMVSTLLELGADLRARSNGGTTAFQFAVRNGDMRTVQAMIAAGADVNDKRPGDFATPLLVAIINGHEDLVDLLLDKGADPNAEGGTTTLTNTGSKASEVKITLKTPSFREQLQDVGTEGDNGRNNNWGSRFRRRARRQRYVMTSHHRQHRPLRVIKACWRMAQM